MKIGLGYDVHRLVDDRPLIIGGVNIPFEKGLDGHSDADVLLHAIADALLGAAKLEDIGKLFPDTDPKYKGADSLKLLENVGEHIKNNDFIIEDIDSVIVAQAPKMSPYRSEMMKNISSTLNISTDKIGIKATTTENLGFQGKGEGISAQAVALLRSK